MTSNRKSPDRKVMKAADVRFFWTDETTRDWGYHWCVDCAWLKELRGMLGQAAALVAGSDPQAFIHLVVVRD